MTDEHAARLTSSLATAMAALEAINNGRYQYAYELREIAENALQRISQEHEKSDATLYAEEQIKWLKEQGKN